MVLCISLSDNSLPRLDVLSFTESVTMNRPPNSADAQSPSASSGGNVEDQLDALISRIHSLSDDRKSSDAPEPSQRARQTPRPAAKQQPLASQAGPSSPEQASAKPVPQASSGSVLQNSSRPADTSTRASENKVIGFQPSRDEPWRPAEPTDFYESRINETLLEAIIYRFLKNIGECEGRKIAEQVRLPFNMITPILDRLKMEQRVAYKSSTATNDYIYVLTESGREIARSLAMDCTYFGACPVDLNDYVISVKKQTIEGQYPKKPDLLRAFQDLLISPDMLLRLGPAVASGRGMFLFGFPGNGKTSIAERVTAAFGKYLWIPRAIEIDGAVLRVFDPMNHEIAMPENNGGILNDGGFDARWVRIKRPTIVAGGELTMEMLEVQSNSESNISEAPLQLKSNCGTLVIDDFGRQKMRVDELLNRWIVPLEKRYDFLNMSNGKKIQVPFDQLVIFSTNLEPKDLVDDAFLRRIPYKIEVPNPPEADFRKLFVIMCKVLKMPYNAEAIDYLIKTHYLPVDRPFRNCQPRDLLLQVRNFCMYNDLKVELKNEYFDFACSNYFSVME